MLLYNLYHLPPVLLSCYVDKRFDLSSGEMVEEDVLLVRMHKICILVSAGVLNLLKVSATSRHTVNLTA
jgi:hypothetical protein